MNLKTPIASVCVLALAGLLSACSAGSADPPEINRETDWVQSYPALGEPISAAAATRDQGGDSRLPTLDDVYDTVLEVSPQVMEDLVSGHPDLADAEITSFAPEWLLDELSDGLSWQHSDALDAELEEQDDRALIIDAYLAPEQHRVVLVLMEM